MTLRQLFYRLVAAGHLPNNQIYYGTLSRESAQARRAGWFPRLIDRTRVIHRPLTFDGPADALGWLEDIYQRPRWEGQPTALYLGVEKSGLVELLKAWFWPLGLPVLPLGGYSSQSFKDNVNDAIADDLREHKRERAVLIYAGDYDPSGKDIRRDFDLRTNFDEVVPIALTWDQVEQYDLPPQPGKTLDSRAARFAATEGRLVQVELDALPPDTLRGLYQAAIDQHWAPARTERSRRRERADVRTVAALRILATRPRAAQAFAAQVAGRAR